jgi:hypothetical protein
MALNWIIAVLGLLYYWIRNYTVFSDKQVKGTFDNFVKNKIDDIFLSVLAVVILSLIVLRVESLAYLHNLLGVVGSPVSVTIVDKLIALAIGLLNSWVMENLAKLFKKIFQKKTK